MEAESEERAALLQGVEENKREIMELNKKQAVLNGFIKEKKVRNAKINSEFVHSWLCLIPF